MPARVARPALALVAALLLSGGIAGCGHPLNPIYKRGYDAGLVARGRFIQQRTPVSNLAWVCAVAAYKDIQDMPNSTADLWQNGFNKGCANVGT
ncbi:MAG TPA: hypothetical protein VGH96_06935 [Streptosporangiaceae bacterium]|jgi:hypothetical protein